MMDRRIGAQLYNVREFTQDFENLEQTFEKIHNMGYKTACIVGYGVIAPNHADAIVNCDFAELYAICDNDAEKLEKAKKDYPGVTVYQDYEDVIGDENIEVVHICTPHYLHGMMAEKALLAGKDVLLEKPVCLNEEDFEKLEKAQDISGKKVCVCFQNRTNACVRKMQEELPALGKIKSLHGTLMWFKDRAYYESGEWRGKWATEGGGLIINQAIHTIDLLGLLSGGFKSVDATLSTKCLGDFIEVEDTADVVFETECGARALFFGSNCYPINAPNVVEIHCEKGSLRYTKETLTLTQDGADAVIATDKSVQIGKSYWGSGHYMVINEFYKLLNTGEGEIISLASVKNTMKTVFALYESGKTNERKTVQ